MLRTTAWRISRGKIIPSFINSTSNLQAIVHNTQQGYQGVEHTHHHRNYSHSKADSKHRQINDSTIYALSTAPGRAAIAIIRVSGPACLSIYHGICPGKPSPKPRYATLRTLYSPEQALSRPQVLDPNALILYFPGPRTVTGEDVLEFHIHGGPAVIKAVLNAIPNTIPLGERMQHSVCYAEPGEFTRRAFYNDRLDLTEIEALGNVLTAETEQQRQLATRGATSYLAKEYSSWRQNLLYARGELEALIDFSEDQHLDESPEKLLASTRKQVEELKFKVLMNIENSFRGELLRNGISVALLGAPNAGKSSLLNTIVGREAAIVSKEEGTTRDIVEVGVDVGGFYCRFSDLAGLHEGVGHERERQVGEIELEGMRRARECVLNADVVIIILSAEDRCMNPAVEAVYTSCNHETQQIIKVISKSDLLQDPVTTPPGNANITQQINQSRNAEQTFWVSCKQAQFSNHDSNTDHQDPGGIQAFLLGLKGVFEKMTSAVHPASLNGIIDQSMWETSLGVTERQRVLLQKCLEAIDGFLDEIKSSESDGIHSALEPKDVDIVVAAENLRVAAECLAKVTGKGELGDVEEVLGVVFEKFCVGK